MEIEFDPVKSELNRQERGFGFGFAATIFVGRVTIAPARTEQGEARFSAIGSINGVCYAVIFVDRNDCRRIISARRANQKETAAWRTQR